MKIQDLADVVPWGRSFDEYQAMFALSESDLQRSILDCGGGPASFAAEAHERGPRVVACDPIYRFSARDIERRLQEVLPIMLGGMEADRDRFVWTQAGSPAAVAERRMVAMRRFLEDFDEGRGQGRYIDEGLPALTFPSGAFDLAVSSHFPFLYADQLSLQFHEAAIDEMLRVAREVRIFPLVDLAGRPSAHVEPVIAHLRERGHDVRVTPVDYEFQRGGNAMLVVRPSPATA